MAFFNIEFYSNCLSRTVSFKMLIPNDYNNSWQPEQKRKDKRMKTLFLLHGFSGNAGNWVPDYLPSLYNFAIVMPNGENSFWIDGEATGRKFGTYLTEELVEYVRKTFGLAMNADETYIMGLSMGGFGALRAALSHPDTFGKVAALSSAYIIHSIAHMTEESNTDGMANLAYYKECFGDLDTVESSINNPEVLVENILKDGRKMPEIYMACGTEDFLLERNRAFDRFLTEKGVEHKYFESKGNHDGVFWNEYAIKMCDIMFENE